MGQVWVRLPVGVEGSDPYGGRGWASRPLTSVGQRGECADGGVWPRVQTPVLEAAGASGSAWLGVAPRRASFLVAGQ